MARTLQQDYTFRERRPALKPDDLPNRAPMMATISYAEERRIPDGFHDRLALCVELAEFGDRYFWPSAGGCQTLQQKYGVDLDKWTGKMVPLTVMTTTNPKSKATIEQVWVLPSDEWDTAFQADIKRVAAKRSKAK